uniref:Trafficking protein particle complex subunit n=1 Tax=Caligus rogercresseyi TaxID=217165 RepID=C1BNY8_CALRO|nr:Trafficking protein particle complex subunit 4 [Caligus rogercresseyi]
MGTRIYNVFIVSKSGGLIYDYDHSSSSGTIHSLEVEKTFGYPLDIRLATENRKIVVEFGARDGIATGHVLASMNGVPVEGMSEEKIQEFIGKEANYPLSLKFGRPRLSTNEKIVLASMFYPFYALAVQLSPEIGSSGIKELETDTFKLYCCQTLTGVKFIVVAEPKTSGSTGIESLLDKIYELYADYALKNPFYSLEMPIRADLFDTHLGVAIDQIERTGFI